jgi:pimeloyl-ACP methyl ester carboxylesterase
VAVILPGSGPTDRDGDNPLGVRAATYRLLAEGLAAEGIASLRIDKRGIGASAAAARSEAELRFNDYVADARAWTSEAVRRTGRPCAWLIGHSEGALVATLAAENNSEICGLVLLSGAGRPAMTVMREQFGAAPEPVRGQALSILDRLERGETVMDVPPALAAAFRPSVQPYLASWAVLDPAEALSRYRGPVFIGQGETDLQTRETDAQALKAARPDAAGDLAGRQPCAEDRAGRTAGERRRLYNARPPAGAGRGRRRGDLYPRAYARALSLQASRVSEKRTGRPCAWPISSPSCITTRPRTTVTIGQPMASKPSKGVQPQRLA